METPLDIPLHVKYIQDLGKSSDELAYHLTSHLRLNAIYWGLTALYLMGSKDALDREEMISFVMSCWDDEAGTFSSAFFLSLIFNDAWKFNCGAMPLQVVLVHIQIMMPIYTRL